MISVSTGNMRKKKESSIFNNKKISPFNNLQFWIYDIFFNCSNWEKFVEKCVKTTNEFVIEYVHIEHIKIHILFFEYQSRDGIPPPTTIFSPVM